MHQTQVLDSELRRLLPLDDGWGGSGVCIERRICCLGEWQGLFCTVCKPTNSSNGPPQGTEKCFVLSCNNLELYPLQLGKAPAYSSHSSPTIPRHGGHHLDNGIA